MAKRKKQRRKPKLDWATASEQDCQLEIKKLSLKARRQLELSDAEQRGYRNGFEKGELSALETESFRRNSVERSLVDSLAKMISANSQLTESAARIVNELHGPRRSL